MVDENRERIERALELVITGLQPFVSEALSAWIPSGQDWTAVLEAKDNPAGIRGKIYRPNDLQTLLRMLTERIGNLGFPFQDRLGRAGQRLASELRDVRNDWAHNEAFGDDDTVRALDTAERLLTLIARPDLASEARSIRVVVRPTPTADEARADEPDGASVDNVVPAADPPEPTTEPTTLSAVIGIVPRPILSYAAAHNRIPVVDSLAIPALDDDVRGAVLQ